MNITDYTRILPIGKENAIATEELAKRLGFESARALINWNPAFLDVFLYYRNRERRPLGSMQAKIAVACKAIRVFYAILQTGCAFDEERFRNDILRPQAV